MTLQFDPKWRFVSPRPIPVGVSRAFYGFIEKMASQRDARWVVEQFKERFSSGIGRSSNLSWAWSDLSTQMDNAADNAPAFIDAFYTGCLDCQAVQIGTPDVDLINAVLSEHRAGFLIVLPNLVATQDFTPIAVPTATPSLAAQARPLIDEALNNADRLLGERKGRQAVSELLWLLESVATAFRGTGVEETIQGKYFNAIVKEMKANSKGKAQEQILNWMTTLHGYLSSPTGGGVRHGTDLTAGIAIQPHEARLYCNLIRSYLVFLIEEHERQVEASGTEFGQPVSGWRG